MLIPTDLLKAALHCASNEETRYYLKGVHLSTSGHMVTTDGHRMFVAKLAEAVSQDVIIPLDTVKTALKLAGKRAEALELNGNTLGGITFTPVDGTFPNWRRVIPPIDGYTTAADGKQGFFNPDYVYDIGQMSRALGSKNGTAFQIHGWDSGSPHGVTFANREDCFAVIMPMRQHGKTTPWNVARSIA
jgi:DNA polymerase III sliding clamp (beta) subunit (PCNA family)